LRQELRLKSPTSWNSSLSQSKLPVLSWRDILKALKESRIQTNTTAGSHILLSNNGNLVAVPRRDEVKPGTLLSIIDQAKLTKNFSDSLGNQFRGLVDFAQTLDVPEFASTLVIRVNILKL